MKFSISLFSIYVLLFIVVFSCSTEEVQDTTPPQSIIQTPQPETPAPIQYTLSVSSGDGGTVYGGTVSSGGTYDEGTDITLTATPNGEYIFSNWSNGSTDNPISFELNSDTNLTANFEKRKYALTINISGEGTVTEEIIETGKSTDYDSGTKVKLTAVPSEGWVFRSWGELIENQELSFEIIIDEPKEVNVVFDEAVEEGYFSIRFEGNGVYQRPNSPYPPLEYQIELISGNKNQSGHFSEGSTLRFTYQTNPGWEFEKSFDRENYTLIPEMAVINDFDFDKWNYILRGDTFVINEDLYIPINVFQTLETFPYNDLNNDGTFLNVGINIGSYPEWNEPNNELNYYVTENFMYPEYVEVYKDRMFEMRQLLGEWGPLDVLIYDWEENPENNREMFKKTREDRAVRAYRNQLSGVVQPIVNNEMERYDRIVSEGGYPFGSADANMGSGKQIGSIFKNKYIEYIYGWSNNGFGGSISDLINSDDFHWEWETGAYHEYVHIWQASQNKHGFISEIAGCHNCNTWTDRDPNLNRIWVAPRWFQEGQCAVIQSILSEKLELRAEQGMCCTVPPPIFKIRYYIEKYLLDNNFDQLRRDETGVNGYGPIGEAASFYKFAKMNYSMETFIAFEVHRGTFGYASALQEFLGISEDDFYNEFNTWFFDSGLTDDQKIDYLWPEGTDPIQVVIRGRR
jgi:hypothetical protein